MGNKKNVNAKDLLLYMLYLNCDGISDNKFEGITRIQKMFFIFEKEILPALNQKEYETPEFFAYNYGPYSKEVSDNIRFFCNIKFINEGILEYDKAEKAIIEESYDESDWLFEQLIPTQNNDSKKEYSYQLTDLGYQYVEENLSDLYAENDKKILMEFKKKIIEMPLAAIIDYVYHKYEDMTEKSLIKDKVMGTDK